MSFVDLGSEREAGRAEQRSRDFPLVPWLLSFDEKTGINPCRCRVENQQTQPKSGAKSENRTWDTLEEGECSHHSTPGQFTYSISYSSLNLRVGTISALTKSAKFKCDYDQKIILLFLWISKLCYLNTK